MATYHAAAAALLLALMICTKSIAYSTMEEESMAPSPAMVAGSSNFVVLGPDAVKVYKEIKVICDPIMEGRRLESIYVMSAQEVYVDKTRKNKIVDLWHARLGHMSYHKLKNMIKKSMLKVLPQLECCEDTTCAGI
ncbi:hypothetical protein ACH5RR_000755 [Cinchona calisaya]|uniref:GAG-pre-integrase domain-containing protein n=1 Tax=Cinchona calisaya TaxID=153742 RepID=A0ABD3B1L5_9GENT